MSKVVGRKRDKEATRQHSPPT